MKHIKKFNQLNEKVFDLGKPSTETFELMNKYGVDITATNVIMKDGKKIGKINPKMVPSGKYFLSDYKGHEKERTREIYRSYEDALKGLVEKTVNESQEIKGKDLQETIDEILDKLSDKGKLSKSEKEFMNATSKDEVKVVTTPQMSGNFWADMANPHNIGIMWQGDDGVWKRLMSLEEEEDEKLDKIEDEDERYYRKRTLEIDRAFKNNPGLKEDLKKLLEMEIKVSEKCNEINKKYRKDSNEPGNHNFNQKLDYATNGTLQSLINQFGDEDDEGNMFIGTKE